MSTPMPKTEKDGEDRTPGACHETDPRMSADYVDPSYKDTEGADSHAPGRGSLNESDREAGVMESGGLEDGAAEIPESDPCPDAYAGWVDLVERIRTSRTDGMAELYELFSKGIRFYLCRQLGPQELDDKVHDTFVVVVQAIRRGELREPQRLMGFVRTIVRRQVAAHIDKVVHDRRDQQDMESTVRIADPRGNPEDAAIFRQRNELIQKVLKELGIRDREILTRFYLREQSQEQICVDMCLSETQFRLLKSRAKARFGELGKKKLAGRALQSVCMRTSAGISH
jgi:RNA polymerase sigma-70 factor, ECF subfamily